MAEKAKTGAANDNPLQKEANARLEACRKQKNEFDLDIRESYAFAAPHLARDIRSTLPPNETKPRDEDEILADASDLAQDFVTEVVNAFMPEATPWADQEPGVMLTNDQKAQVEKVSKEQNDTIFKAIKASNLYTVLPTAAAPDLAIGTMAMWIDDPYPGQNFVCQAVPLRELEINIGPHGGVDDRFIVRHTRNKHVKTLIGNIALPEEIDEEIQRNPEERTELRWGFWRDWTRRDDIVWRHVVMVKDKIAHETTIVGAGSCPLIVTRFNPSAQWAYGWGPLPRSLRDLRLLDSLLVDILDFLELKLRPPMGFPDDTFANIANGIEPGSAYPIRPGSEDAIRAIFDGGDANPALFQTAEIYDRLNKRFYLGFPEQRGKTPPTLGQWLDEMARAQRRIGTPGLPFWREGPAEYFLRFKYLLEKRGVIEPVKIDGKTVALTPFNPTQRAAEQQDVAMAVQYMGIAGQTWPEESRIEIDGAETMKAIAKKMRVDGLIKFRSTESKQQAVAQIAQLMEGRQRINPVDPASVQGI